MNASQMMKPISNQAFKALSAVAAVFLYQQVHAQQTPMPTQCRVYLSAPCLAVGPNPYFAPHQYFIDVDLLSNLDAARCAQRAQEYGNYCDVPGGQQLSTTYTQFLVFGRPVLSAASTQNKSYIYNGLWLYSGFAK